MSVPWVKLFGAPENNADTALSLRAHGNYLVRADRIDASAPGLYATRVGDLC